MDPGMPPPPPPAPSTPSGRYAYLVARLRNRQITMDEATELFEIQQMTLSRALARAAPPAPDAPSSTARPPTPSPTSQVVAGTPGSDDLFWMGLLAAGAGAGLLAAVLRRAQEGPGRVTGVGKPAGSRAP